MSENHYSEIMKTLRKEGAIGQVSDSSIQPKKQDLKDISKICKALRKGKHVQYACLPFKDNLCTWSCNSCRYTECGKRDSNKGCEQFFPKWKDVNLNQRLSFDCYLYRIVKKGK